jgi:phosphoserine aminotransferase
MLNTTPTFGVYLMGLVQDWIAKEGGWPRLRSGTTRRRRFSMTRSTPPISHLSRGKKQPLEDERGLSVKGGNEEVEKKFISGAKAAGLAASRASLGGRHSRFDLQRHEPRSVKARRRS